MEEQTCKADDKYEVESRVSDEDDRIRISIPSVMVDYKKEETAPTSKEKGDPTIEKEQRAGGGNISINVDDIKQFNDVNQSVKSSDSRRQELDNSETGGGQLHSEGSCINVPKTLAGGDRETLMSAAKGVDFAIEPANVYLDEVDEEINQVINSSTDDQMQFGFSEQVNHSCGLTVNTPATEMTDSHFQIHSIRTPMKERYYEDAVMLMNCRCKSGSTYLTSATMKTTPKCMRTTSGRQVPVFTLPSLVAHINKPPFSCNPNSYFYVRQQIKQEPNFLKAWKGYHGNVYFEPMTCKQLASGGDKEHHIARSSNKSSKTGRFSLPNLDGRSQSRVSFASDTKTDQSNRVKTRSRSVRSSVSRSNKSTSQNASISQKMRQMSILDRQSVMKRSNSRLSEDMNWISGQESTGSLCIGQPQQRTKSQAYSDSDKHYKLKICRGIASRSKDYIDQSPVFSLNGGKLNESWLEKKFQPSSRLVTATPEDSTEFYRYSSNRTSVVDGSQGNIDQSNDLVHVVPSPSQGNPRKLNIKDTSLRLTFSH
ncbi:uncharacterized protein [Antedon mediterranea]|uniref:uncharacterized protein n=1 Tax=Antedon mediterranea TaxID=105859 RepID=UPI003AF5AF23